MADFRIKYPSTSTSAFTCAFASLATDTNLLAGRASTAVENTNDDLDIVIGGEIVTGTTPTVNTFIEVWLYTAKSIASGTPTYVDSITGTDANKTLTSLNVKVSGLTRLKIITVTATSNVAYPIGDISLALLLGYVPEFFGVFVVHNTGVNLNATQTTGLNYRRVQYQSV